jgi:hypothetical protein
MSRRQGSSQPDDSRVGIRRLQASVFFATAGLPTPQLAQMVFCRYLAPVKWLTKQEQMVVAAVAALLLAGLLVKYMRLAH